MPIRLPTGHPALAFLRRDRSPRRSTRRPATRLCPRRRRRRSAAGTRRTGGRLLAVVVWRDCVSVWNRSPWRWRIRCDPFLRGRRCGRTASGFVGLLGTLRRIGASRAPCSGARSGAQTMTAPRSTPLDHVLSVGRAHPHTEAVRLLPLAVVRLECAFHWKPWSPPREAKSAYCTRGFPRCGSDMEKRRPALGRTPLVSRC